MIKRITEASNSMIDTVLDSLITNYYNPIEDAIKFGMEAADSAFEDDFCPVLNVDFDINPNDDYNMFEYSRKLAKRDGVAANVRRLDKKHNKKSRKTNQIKNKFSEGKLTKGDWVRKCESVDQRDCKKSINEAVAQLQYFQSLR